jgi:hypothetical protein
MPQDPQVLCGFPLGNFNYLQQIQVLTQEPCPAGWWIRQELVTCEHHLTGRVELLLTVLSGNMKIMTPSGN